MTSDGSLQRILDKMVDNRKIFGAAFCIKYGDDLWCGGAGNLAPETRYFIASTTKLFVTAVILNLEADGRLSLDDRISGLLDQDLLQGLHLLKGQDHTGEITIRHLLAHTSGLPDYFIDKDNSGTSLEKRLLSGRDWGWSCEEAVAISKSIRPRFRPGAKGRAHYSDTNFQLLGRIIECLTGQPVDGAFEEIIIQPLGLKRTYLYTDENDGRPLHLYYKNKALNIPNAMVSFGPDGGVVSTAEEMLRFIEAFFTGRFFPKERIGELGVWNRIFFPLQSGIGIHRFKLPRIFDPLGATPELIGHSGLSGALAYHAPEKDLYIAGTVNQIAWPGTSFRTAVRLIQTVLKG